jgi:hypothetical protein
MVAFLQANIGTILVAVLVAVIVVSIIVSIHKRKKRGVSSCGCGCSHCDARDSCHAAQDQEK